MGIEDRLLITLNSEQRNYILNHLTKSCDAILTVRQEQNYIEADCLANNKPVRYSLFLYESGKITKVAHD